MSRRFIVVVVPILMQILTGHWIVLLQYDEAAVSDGGGQTVGGAIDTRYLVRRNGARLPGTGLHEARFACLEG